MHQVFDSFSLNGQSFSFLSHPHISLVSFLHILSSTNHSQKAVLFFSVPNYCSFLFSVSFTVYYLFFSFSDSNRSQFSTSVYLLFPSAEIHIWLESLCLMPFISKYLFSSFDYISFLFYFFLSV